MQNFIRFCSIVSIIIASIKLALMGNLSPGIVVFIIFCGLLILLASRTIYIITAAVAALVLFIKIYGGRNPAVEFALLQSVLALALICFGIYVMLRGVFPVSRGRRRY